MVNYYDQPTKMLKEEEKEMDKEAKEEKEQENEKEEEKEEEKEDSMIKSVATAYCHNTSVYALRQIIEPTTYRIRRYDF